MTVFALCLGLAAGISSWLLTGAVRGYATQRNMLDIPNARSSHALPTPRGGGLAIVATFSATVLVLALGRQLDVKTAALLLVSGGIVAATGYLDDRRSLPAQWRFGAHFLAAGIFVVLIGKVPQSFLVDFGLRQQWLGALVVVLALTWSTNLFNFMDGIDGIAASEAAFIAGAAAWINLQKGDPGLTLALVSLCAASAGFLAWNWPPARIFMGDVGSGFLGLVLPMLELAASERAAIPLQVWVILAGLFLVDATVTLLRRALRGDRLFEAHRLHGYQRLARRWKGHLPVTLLFAAINLFWLLPWAWYAAKTPIHATLFLGAAVLPLVVLALVAGSGNEGNTQ
jgi:Fuc2NAc and GlcNAc transferase